MSSYINYGIRRRKLVINSNILNTGISLVVMAVMGINAATVLVSATLLPAQRSATAVVVVS